MLEPTDTGNAVRQAGIFALAGFRGPKVTDALLAIARADTAAQPMVIHGAAIETLGRMGFVEAIGPIIELMVAQPRLGDSARAALASLGDGAIAPLTANLASPPPEGSSGTVKFHAARTLGDLRAVEAVPQLLASLAEPAEPAMFSRSGEFGPTHHVAVIEALQKIAGEEAAEPLRAYWQASDDDSLRTLALDAYGWVPRTSVAHAELIALLGDGARLPQIRTAAGLAYARTVYDKTQLGALTAAANKALAGDESERKWHRVMAGLIARANVGASCRADVACYQAILAKSDEQLVTEAVAAIPQADKLSDSDRAIPPDRAPWRLRRERTSGRRDPRGRQAQRSSRSTRGAARVGRGGRAAVQQVLRRAHCDRRRDTREIGARTAGGRHRRGGELFPRAVRQGSKSASSGASYTSGRTRARARTRSRRRRGRWLPGSGAPRAAGR